ncbi:MAG: hypothetical protein KDE31_12600 [Caldilineaceae bacterium]|nr:hypothetical protein [Caldilineaceae bacterium]
MYEIEYTADAQADLAYFQKHEQVLIVAEVERRLRNFRVFYNPDEIVQIVDIIRVGEKRGNTVFFRGKRGEL